MDVGWGLRLRYGEKLIHLSKEEEERRTAIAVELSLRGTYSPGATTERLFGLRTEYAEKRLNAFLDTIRELMDLREIKPSAQFKQKLLPELDSIFKGVEAGLKNAKSGSNLLNIPSAKELEHEVEAALAQIRRRIQNRFDSMFFDEIKEEK